MLTAGIFDLRPDSDSPATYTGLSADASNLLGRLLAASSEVQVASMNLAFRSLLLLAGACSIGVRASQYPLLPNQGHVEPARSGNSYDPYEPYDAGLFTPVSDLRSISDSAYTILTHPQFPKHSVRIKESQFCDGTVR